jgi:hypothetical protein
MEEQLKLNSMIIGDYQKTFAERLEESKAAEKEVVVYILMIKKMLIMPFC